MNSRRGNMEKSSAVQGAILGDIAGSFLEEGENL